MSSTDSVRRILFLAANPQNTGRLQLDKEAQGVKSSLQLAKHRDRFKIIAEWAVGADELRRALLEHEPHIVHFSGHGEGQDGLVLDDGQGKKKRVTSKALARLFKQFPGIECVLLNACYSDIQAQAIVSHVPYVIGMNQAIGDEAAIKFAMGFYDGLGYGRSYPAAFEFGLSAIDLEDLPETATPVLNQKGAVVTPELPQGCRVFISYRDQLPDKQLAQAFFEALEAAGQTPFMAGTSLQLGDTWVQRIRQELDRSDYLLLLLSPQSATSEMVTEEVRRAKRLQEERQVAHPAILPIRVQFPLEHPLNYDLRGYLQQIHQREWHTEANTAGLIAEVVWLVQQGAEQQIVPPTPEEESFQTPAIESVEHPPLPVADPELKREPGGSVRLTSSLYVERSPIEADCFEEIMQPGSLIRIKAPRQMGKTSLMARILNHAREQGCQAISLSFQRADHDVFTDLDRLLRWVCEQLGRRLKRLKELDDYWAGDYGSKDKCNVYLEECLLEEIDAPLVLGLDEVDMVFPHREIADSFFALVRSWYEMARYGDLMSELWEKLRLVVVHSTEVYVPLNINQSPFNVGKNVELPEFTFEQILDLSGRYGVSGGEALAQQLLQLVGGHPYLVRKALYHLRRQDLSLRELVTTAQTEGGIYNDHLRRHLLNLQDYPPLAAALRQVVSQSRAVEIDAESAFKLESMGLVALQGNKASPRCDVYRQYFCDHLA
ncbi:MAG: TIR domain-containing protein [Spirulina sp. SIO3F2]|nr:TIR domain-containing protein [Spirulina sp. SIO3F2]